MSAAVDELPESFDHLSDEDKLNAAYEILRRTVEYDLPPLSDEELVLNAEAIFLELDKRELGNG
jgi:hypothetical protein